MIKARPPVGLLLAFFLAFMSPALAAARRGRETARTATAQGEHEQEIQIDAQFDAFFSLSSNKPRRIMRRSKASPAKIQSGHGHKDEG